MIDLSRVFNNLLTLGVFLGIGYVIYMKVKGGGGLDKLKGRLGNMVSKGNEFRRGKI